MLTLEPIAKENCRKRKVTTGHYKMIIKIIVKHPKEISRDQQRDFSSPRLIIDSSIIRRELIKQEDLLRSNF